MNPKRLLLVLLVLAVLLPLAALAEAPAYEVTLPDGYDGTTQHYPTLYILPEDGFTPDASGLAEQLSAAIARGEGTEMILVRPALAEGDPAAQVADVVAVVDAAYRTIPDPAYRAAVGTGTGGYLAYALTLAENSPFQAAASIRGDFASEDNPWLSVCGDIQAKLEALHSADADALNAFYTYLDAPVEDAWTDMKGSTDDLGSLFITYGTGSAFHEFTVRPGAFDEAFLAESASRVLSRLTGRLLSGIVSGQLTMEKTTLGKDDAEIVANYSIALGDISAFTDAELPLEVAVTVYDSQSEALTVSEAITSSGAAEGKLTLPNSGTDASATAALTVRLLGTDFQLANATLIRAQDPVIDGDWQEISLMGDWYFNYVGAAATIDVSALSKEEYEGWAVVQPGLGNWAKGYGNISEENVTSPIPDYFGFFIVGSGYYAKTFTVPEGFDAKELELAIGYVDDRCEVFVNGQRVGATGMDENGQPTGDTTWAVFSHFAIDPAVLNIGGENTVVVRAWNDLPYGAGGWYGGPIGLYSKTAFDAQYAEGVNPRFYEESYDSQRVAAAKTLSGTAEEKYLIYLPEGYETSERYYPTIYLLHQFNSDHTSYRTDHVDELLDEGIRNGLFDEVIVVIPNSDENSWWTGQWEKMITDELIPLIESKYRAIPDARYRLTAGCSMGGQGAYGVALRNPNYFTGAVSFFGAFSYGGASSPNAIAAVESADYLSSYALYFICGNQDNYGFGAPAIQLHQQLSELNVPHRFFIENGAHDSAFYVPYFQEGIAYARANMYHSDDAVEALLSGALAVDGAKLTATLTADEAITAYLREVPASSYTLDAAPALNIPVLVTVEMDGETLCSAAQTVQLSADSLTAEAAFDLPADLDLTGAKVSAKAAIFDRVVELATNE